MKKQNKYLRKRLKVSVVMVAAAAMAGLMSCTVYADSVVIRAGVSADGYGPGYVQSPVEGNTAQRDVGWRYLDGNWYFYYLTNDGIPERNAGGWMWVDGYCYYFYEDGRMAAAGVTPDGYWVSDSGAWVENGVAVFVPGKGILTRDTGVQGNSGGNRGGGSSSPGGGNSSGGGGSSPGGGSSSSGGGSGSPGGGGNSSGGGSGSLEDENAATDIGGSGTKPEGDGSEDIPEAEEPDSDQDEETRSRLEHWQELARRADYAITGIDNPLDQSYLVYDKAANDRRMKNMVSMISDWELHEFYMIGVDYQAETLILGQVFREQILYSNTVVDSFDIHGVSYSISRIGIQKIQDNTQDDIEDGTIADGTITDGSEEGEEEIPSVGMHYSYGDVIRRRIGGQSYRFRCIDEDYRDAAGNYRGVALFLCDTVIRSDVDGHGDEADLLTFGSDNNYKNSEIRKWLIRNTSDSDFPQNPVNIGIENAYEGSTEADCWEQIEADELRSCPLKRQKLSDGIFLLSVEEALWYAGELWRFDGSEQNNPEDVYSPWSKGYYLRTPLYEESEDGEFCYGNGIYIVDLLEGNIHSVDVSYTTMGLRPAFVLPNA